MPGKILKVCFLALFFVGCADPKYVRTGGNGNSQKNATTCQTKFSSGECVGLAWEKMPTETDFGSFIFKTFRLNRGDGSPIPEDLNGTLAVVLWMPSMGHGSSPVTVERLDVGTYRASKVFFSMKGDWEIRVQTKNGDTVNDQAVISVTL